MPCLTGLCSAAPPPELLRTLLYSLHTVCMRAGMFLTMMYFLYLFLTRNVLDIFNCAPTDPPDGHTYLQVLCGAISAVLIISQFACAVFRFRKACVRQPFPCTNSAWVVDPLFPPHCSRSLLRHTPLPPQVVFERCGKPGGVQVRLLPFAIIGLAVYVLGYPLVVAFILYRNRDQMREDQLLRAMGTGSTRLTNPHGMLWQRISIGYLRGCLLCVAKGTIACRMPLLCPFPFFPT
jgi:hypothetical protein